ncbi:putative secreted protein (Por secretion system target) [Flavobacterium sp. 90]|uniref:T9SS type A sorting domain-containing protein n=1 Tax=unclassified Flavobacterium TaxID=196869 RepID=UPI000EB165EE|nr:MULTISPECIES: T9SS type A sorting domain-containing protein [unclassified Flavobacterium]RKR11425.1 putative secreted protein (Por secretion system target) [Flavobacterium sp. 81]TCK55206.1 putative secreted protein (Por secretion system target) [Flavobacterium sp. 90]
MKNNYISNFGSVKRKFFLLSVFFLLIISIGRAQTIDGLNPYCISSSPYYRILNAPDINSYDSVVWTASDNSGITFSGDPSAKSLNKVVVKPGNLITAPYYIYATFYSGVNFVAETAKFYFITPTPPTTPSYNVTKTNDYCTPQYHIITLNVTPNPNPSPNTNYSIAPRIADASIVITQTSKNIFELKLPLNGDPYFLYDVTSSTSSSGCLSNSVTTTAYGNSVSLNLTGCANNAPGTNYEFTASPNPYSNGYLTIVAPAVTPAFTGTCKVFNSSGVLMTSFPLLNSSTAIQLKSTVGSSLISGLYVVQVTYQNGNVRTKNLVVN